jgi:hypothetical protein
MITDASSKNEPQHHWDILANPGPVNTHVAARNSMRHVVR